MRLIVLTVLLAGAAFAQATVANPGFEQGELGGMPTGWFAPPMAAQSGFGVKLVDQGCRTGRCAMMTGAANPPANIFGNVVQSLAANAYTLRRIRPFRLPGGDTVSWTGMKLVKHDAAQHH